MDRFHSKKRREERQRPLLVSMPYLLSGSATRGSYTSYIKAPGSLFDINQAPAVYQRLCQIETQGEPADTADYRATVCAVGEPAQADANKPDRSAAFFQDSGGGEAWARGGTLKDRD